jgi:hypothetical protein
VKSHFRMGPRTSLFQLATAIISAVVQNAILEIESSGISPISTSLASVVVGAAGLDAAPKKDISRKFEVVVGESGQVREMEVKYVCVDFETQLMRFPRVPGNSTPQYTLAPTSSFGCDSKKIVPSN